MSKYKVVFEKISFIEITVDAENEEEARIVATDCLEYKTNSDWSTDSIELTEVAYAED